MVNRTLYLTSEDIDQIIKYLNQIISENKPYNLRLCTFTFHKFEEKNLNLNRDSMINRWHVVSWITHPCRKWQTFQEESLKMNWNKNQGSSMVERQARDLEVRVRIPVQI